MSNIVVFGGSGFAGGQIAAEAARRGHQVTSVSRTLPSDRIDGVAYRAGSIHDAGLVADLGGTADVVVVALPAREVDGKRLIEALPALTAAVAGRPARLGFVGGAGSSLVAEGGPRAMDTPEFPAAYLPEAQGHADILEALRSNDSSVNWFVLSPAGLFGAHAGVAATGAYRTGDDLMVVKQDGSSEIAGEDYALAFVDEIDRPAHQGARFTVGH